MNKDKNSYNNDNLHNENNNNSKDKTRVVSQEKHRIFGSGDLHLKI